MRELLKPGSDFLFSFALLSYFAFVNSLAGVGDPSKIAHLSNPAGQNPDKIPAPQRVLSGLPQYIVLFGMQGSHHDSAERLERGICSPWRQPHGED